MSDAGSELILHQYEGSPFSEKVRKALAHKRLSWRAVEQPMIMPKPDLVPLTGGYRRIPVLQIGADVYCDTQLIVRVLEERHPTPSLHAGGPGTCHAWNLWADKMLFTAVVPVFFAELGGSLPQAFLDDRQKMMPDRDLRAVAAAAPHAREQVRALVELIERQLDAGPFLLGPEFSLADAACYHPLWFLRLGERGRALLEPFPLVRAWMGVVSALGNGDPKPMAASEALAIARAATPLPGHGIDPGEPNALRAGTRVTVTPDDYGFDPVEGELVTATRSEVAVARTDPGVGRVVVHFPRIGFRVARAG
jgi:glutathione S-transferase